MIVELALAIRLVASAQGADLDEAAGLDESKPAATSRAAPQPLPQARTWNTKFRGYVLAEAIEQRLGLVATFDDVPAVESGFTLGTSVGSFEFFADATGRLHSNTWNGLLTNNQIGARYRVVDEAVVAIGKERHRQSPGLIVSPFEFVFLENALPGLREDRTGKWLARASYQTSLLSLDAMVLPWSAESPQGFPYLDSALGGWVLRASAHPQILGNWDIQVQGGNVRTATQTFGNRIGASLAGYIGGVLKTYGEFRFTERSNATQWLAGLGYEGWDKVQIRAEFFEQGENATATGFTPFLRRQYVIGNVALVELWDVLNSQLTAIKSLEDDGLIGLWRMDYLAGSHATLGMTIMLLACSTGSQYTFRTLDRQISIDWKYTF